MCFARSVSLVLASATVMSVATFPAAAVKPLRGPVTARVVDVIDGDTFVADALVWPGLTVRVNVRIRGVDAPEMKSRCRAEQAAARRAREALLGLLDGSSVSISNIAGAKYHGRVLADVTTEEGDAVAASLIAADLVRVYAGGKRTGWCP